tara:strand:+ start:3155 stop:6289 length:3135 start_codon:yes stop_codon:yes gene_type:complete
MLDIDGVSPPEGMSVIETATIEWLIREKLPDPFQNVSYFYQFSSSAGVLDHDGELLKPGLRVHLYFYLDRRETGPNMAAYLKLHCLETGFYWKKRNKGGVAMLQYGIDIAPVLSSVQVHYTAAPVLGEGVGCALDPDQRQGLVPGGRDTVQLPDFTADLKAEVQALHNKVRREYQIELGYVPRTLRTKTPDGFGSTTYLAPPGDAATIRTGRTLADTKLSGDFCILYFDDENTSGSWYVGRKNPQWAFRYGDGEHCPLKELSSEAYAFVRDQLQWFSEVPAQKLTLQEGGYVPPIGTFVEAKNALVLAPTGSGKTRRVIEWIDDKRHSASIIYVSPTIALVNQMCDDLRAAGVPVEHYTDVFPGTYEYSASIDGSKVFVTTGKSIKKVFRAVQGRFYVIYDEVHRALDDVCRSNTEVTQFRDLLRASEGTLFLTGTLTETQHQMLSQQVCEAGTGRLTASDYCVYEFTPVRSYPLDLRDLSFFDGDVVKLVEETVERVKRGEPIERTVLMMDTSRLESYRQLAVTYDIGGYVTAVSRPENQSEEIEQARRGNTPILICSPLFNVGLNLDCPPRRLWALFRYIPADTNTIIQSINRANRTDAACDVRIYAAASSVNDADPAALGRSSVERERIAQWFAAELDLPVDPAVDIPMLLDRNQYLQKRKAEDHSNRSLKALVESDGFQNYRLRSVFEKTDEKPADGKPLKEALGVARAHYEQTVIHAIRLVPCDWSPGPVGELEYYQRERRRRGFGDGPFRTEREIEQDELAVVMKVCGMGKVADARKVNIRQLRVFLADTNPWISDQYNLLPNSQAANQARADKLDLILPIVGLLEELQAQAIDGREIAKRLVRGDTWQNAFCALQQSEQAYVGLRRRFETLRELRRRSKQSGTLKNRKAGAAYARKLTIDLLSSIGLAFDKVDHRIELSSASVPLNWELLELRRYLLQRRDILRAMPEPIATELDTPREWHERYGQDDDVDFKLPTPVDVGTCLDCLFFFRGRCAKCYATDFSSLGIQCLFEIDTVSTCVDKRPIDRRARHAERRGA